MFQMSKFKVVSKIERKIMDKSYIIGYKIHSGFSIFYVTPTGLKEAELMGLIEKTENQIDSIDYNRICEKNGVVAESRLNYALKTTTISKLKAALEVNKSLTAVDIEIIELGNFIKGYRVDASENTLALINQQNSYLLRRDFETLYSLTDFFCSLLGRHFINIENILEFLKEEKGSTIFTCLVYEKGKDTSEIRVI